MLRFSNCVGMALARVVGLVFSTLFGLLLVCGFLCCFLVLCVVFRVALAFWCYVFGSAFVMALPLGFLFNLFLFRLVVS